MIGILPLLALGSALPGALVSASCSRKLFSVQDMAIPESRKPIIPCVYGQGNVSVPPKLVKY